MNLAAYNCQFNCKTHQQAGPALEQHRGRCLMYGGVGSTPQNDPSRSMLV